MYTKQVGDRWYFKEFLGDDWREFYGVVVEDLCENEVARYSAADWEHALAEWGELIVAGVAHAYYITAEDL